LIENSDGAAEGVTLTFIAPPWTSSGAAQKFLDVYKKEYGNPPMSFAPLGYDAVMVFSEGLSKSGAIDRAKFISTLHQPGFVYQGVTSKIHFDTKGDNTGAMVYVYKVSNGEFVYME
jgi:branched-chain amino acid transport system substrate-binding protein